MKYMAHLRERRKKDGYEAHEAWGLIDDDGVVVARTIREAQKIGIVPKKVKKPKDEPLDTLFEEEDEQESGLPFETNNPSEKEDAPPPKQAKSPIRGRATYMNVTLHQELLVFYNLAITSIEGYRAEFSDWLLDVVIGYYRDHPELGLYALLESSPKIKRALMMTASEMEGMGNGA